MVYVDSITLDPKEMTIPVGGWYNGPKVTISPANATKKSVTWLGSDDTVAVVNSSTGMVFGNEVGEIRVYATAKDGSGANDYYTLTVCPRIPVTSITLSRTEVCMERDQSFILYAAVEPDNATDKALHWSSSNSYVATVENGVVTTHNSGTATIAAMPRDGSNVIATCTVRVTEDRLVTSVEIDDPPTTMIVGDTQVLQASVYPDDATHKSVVWHSEDETIATVNPDTGLLTAQSEGITWIYATAKDGSGSYGVFTLEVKKPSVTVMKDGDYHKVVFNETGKVWRCIEHDIIFAESPNSLRIRRANRNYYIRTSEDGHPLDDDVQVYSDDEIKVLYAIDPYGVAAYICRYAEYYKDSQPNGNMSDIVGYKDRIFTMLFNREPKYFKRNAQGEWQEINLTETSNMDEILSESESVFGRHPIADEYNLRMFLDSIVSITKTIVTAFMPGSKVANVINTAQDIIKCAVLGICGANESFFYEVTEFVDGQVTDRLNSVVEKFFEDCSISPFKFVEEELQGCLDTVESYVDMLTTLNGWVDSMESVPGYFKQAVAAYAYDFEYAIYLDFGDGKICQMKDVEQALKSV